MADYKHKFSFASDWSRAILLATVCDNRKNHRYEIDVLEEFPNTLSDQEKIDIMREVIVECNREIKRTIKNSMEDVH